MSSTTEPVFRSDMTVDIVQGMASDQAVLSAARVSTLGDITREEWGGVPMTEEGQKRDKGLINYLMRDRHGSPFEHTFMTFYIEAPIFVFREFMRHRIASYNEESSRYKQLGAVFYTPSRERNLQQVGRPGAYDFVPGTDEQIDQVALEVRSQALLAYAAYQRMLDAGIAREVARIVLPVNTYSSMYVSMNARALMNFLSLRTKREGSHFPSFPQREIEMVAEEMETLFAYAMPWTYEAFNKNGRVAP